jgi:hypothetical protein
MHGHTQSEGEATLVRTRTRDCGGGDLVSYPTDGANWVQTTLVTETSCPVGVNDPLS